MQKERQLIDGWCPLQKLRLFWAVNLPLEIRKKLFSAGERLREAGADAKWVEENNLHLTVKFLGDADQGMVERIAQSAAGRLGGFGKFSLDLKGTGFFPGARSPKVLWVGLGGDVGKLRALALTLEEAMESLGFPGEGRKFSPHLTLARIRSPRNVDRLAGLVQPGLPELDGLGSFTAESVELMSSTLGRSGPTYRPVASIRLE